MSDQERANELIEQANALQAAGKKLEAAPMFVEAAGLFSPYASFALVAGDSFAEAGKPHRAAEAYRMVLIEHPDHDQALEGLGKALLATGDEQGARDAYRKAGLTLPGDAKPGFLKRWFGIGR